MMISPEVILHSKEKVFCKENETYLQIADKSHQLR